MKIWGRDLVARQIATCLVFFVAAQLSYGLPAQSQTAAQQDSRATQVAENATSGAPLPDAPAPQQQAAPPASAQQDNGQKPVGTAVAPVMRPSGVAGSSPSGAAIAPAKQRRVHRILIRVAIIVGAAAAVGAVAGLSRASSSHP